MFIFLLYSCNSNFKKSKDVGNFRLYELQCSNQYYLSLENCDCKNLPKNYFIPKGDNDSYYEIFIKDNNGKLQVNSLYNRFEIYGNIKQKVDFIIHTDNSSFIDSIQKINYTVIRGYSNGTMRP